MEAFVTFLFGIGAFLFGIGAFFKGAMPVVVTLAAIKYLRSK